MPKGHAKKNANVVYMATTADVWEWPVAIAETAVELDRILGRCEGWTYQTLSHDKKRERRRCHGSTKYLHVYRIEV